MIERLDGFTNEGFGNVIAGALQEGDVVRENGTTERRYYAQLPPSGPQPRAATRREVLSNLPPGRVRAWSLSTDDEAGDTYALLLAVDTITPSEWARIGDALEGATILSSAENATFKSAKPVSGG